MSLKENSAFHIQNLIEIEPECQVVELKAAESIEMENTNIKAFFLSKVIVNPDGSIALPLYEPSSKDIFESLKNLNKLIRN